MSPGHNARIIANKLFSTSMQQTPYTHEEIGCVVVVFFERWNIIKNNIPLGKNTSHSTGHFVCQYYCLFFVNKQKFDIHLLTNYNQSRSGHIYLLFSSAKYFKVSGCTILVGFQQLNQFIFKILVFLQIGLLIFWCVGADF